MKKRLTDLSACFSDTHALQSRQSGMFEEVVTAFLYLGVKASFPSSLQILNIQRLKMRSFPNCPNERDHAGKFAQKVLLNRRPLRQMGKVRTHKCPPTLKRVFRGHPQRDYKRHQGDIDAIFTRIFPQ
jgi:hypothetical protein